MKKCPECLEEFDGRSNKKFCSPSCKQLHHKRKQSVEQSQVDATAKTKGNKPTTYSKKALAQEYQLRQLEIETNYKIKLLELEERARLQELARLELEAAKRKQETEQKLKLMAAEEEKKWLPIKNAILEVLSEAIENSDEVMEVEDLEQLIEGTLAVRNQLRTYLIYKGEDYQIHPLNKTMTTLLDELKAISKDEACYEEDGIVLDFDKSYLKELKNLQKQIMNG